MLKAPRYHLMLGVCLLVCLALAAAGCGGGGGNPDEKTKICLIHYYDNTAIANLATFFEDEGYEVHTVNIGVEFPADITGYDLFFIDNSTGQWNTPQMASQAEAIQATGTPCLGLGQAMLKFLDYVDPQIELRYGNGGHFGFCYMANVVDAADPLWQGLTVANGDTVSFYSDPTTNGAGVAVTGLGAGVEQYGTWTLSYPEPAANCAVLAKSGRFFLWGFYGRPDGLTQDGLTVFRNAITMMLTDD